MKVEPNDGRPWEYREQWKGLTWKQEKMEDDMDKDKYERLKKMSEMAPNRFKMEGDDYSIEVNQEMKDDLYF